MFKKKIYTHQHLKQKKMEEKQSKLYTCIKPPNNSFFIYVILDFDNQICKINYYMGFYRGTANKIKLCKHWNTIVKQLPLKHKKKSLKVTVNTVKNKGRAQIHSSALSNIFGFAYNPECYLPVKIESSVNIPQTVIEITCYLKFSHIRNLIDKYKQLPIFTADPDKEYVRQHLRFFDPHCVKNSNKTNVPKNNPSSVQDVLQEPNFIVDQFPNPHDRLKQNV